MKNTDKRQQAFDKAVKEQAEQMLKEDSKPFSHFKKPFKERYNLNRKEENKRHKPSPMETLIAMAGLTYKGKKRR